MKEDDQSLSCVALDVRINLQRIYTDTYPFHEQYQPARPFAFPAALLCSESVGISVRAPSSCGLEGGRVVQMRFYHPRYRHH